MSAEFYLARRYMFTHGQGAWGWLIGWMATGSVALGVGALIITLAVMTGFGQDIREKILGVHSHLIVSPFDGKLDPADKKIAAVLGKEKGVVAWSPYVSGQVLIGRGSQNSGAMVKGIDPKREPTVSNLENKLSQDTWPNLGINTQGRPRIFLGIELARNIGARLGDTVWLVTPGSIGITAFSVPKAHLFVVTGFVQSGLYDYDSSLAYVNLPEAQKLFGLGQLVSGVGVRVEDPEKAETMSKDLQDKFEGDYWVNSWLARNKNLFSALKLEKAVMFVILTLVTIVASIMIVSNLLLSISQKVKEIGILRAMGATRGVIRRIFLYQGLLMGAVGTAIGVVLGILISLLLQRTNLIRLPADVYYIDHLPIRLDPMDILAVVAAAVVIVLVATFYPANRAAELDPLDAIRYG